MHFDLAHFKEMIGVYGSTVGYLVIWGIVFAESGLLIGCFLPGDSLLFIAGVLASQNLLNIFVLCFGTFVFAVLGDNVGYATGHRFGRRLFQKEDSWLFHKKHLVTAQNFYEKHGKKAIVLARFMPIVRTFAPIVAGIGSMQYKIFFAYNLIGGLCWGVGVTLLGYFLGNLIPADQVDKYLLPIVLAIIVFSVVPSIIHVIKENKSTKS